jgi:hypothetical protein
MNASSFNSQPTPSASPQDAREWMPQDGSAARRALVVLGAKILPQWLDRSVDVVQVRFVGDLAQTLTDLVAAASAKKGKSLPTNRLKASLALALDGVILIDRHLGLHPERPKAAIELYTEADDDEEVVERVRSCLKTWNNDVVQAWAHANALGDAAERLSKAILAQDIAVSRVSQPLVVSSPGSRLGKPVYHLIARRLAEELVGASLFEGMSAVDLVVDPTNTTASVELLTQPVRMEGSRSMFSMAARLSVFTMPGHRDLYVKVTPVKRIWSSELPGRKPNAPPSTTCTVMVPGKPFFTIKAIQAPIDKAATEKASPWHFSDEYEEFLRRSQGQLPATLRDVVAEVAPDPAKGGWWVGFPRLTTLFDRIGGRTVFERDEYDLHETVVQMLPWALDPKIEVRRIKGIAQKAAADATHTALKPSDIGRADEVAEPGRAGQALLDDDVPEDDAPPAQSDSESARLDRLALGRASNVSALRAIYPDRPIHLFVFGGEQQEQAIIRACAAVLFGDAVQIHTEALPLHTHGLKADLEKANAKSLERFEARVARWEAAFAQLPDDGGVRYVLICADRLINRRIEDPVNYYAAIHAACRAAGANVHHVLPIQQKRGKDDVGHFVHRVQSAMLDVFLAHSGVILGVRELVSQTIGQGREPDASSLPQYVLGIQALRTRARRRSAESDVTFILYSRLSLRTGLVEVRVACRIGRKDTLTDWMDLASGLRWLGAQRHIASNENWIRDNFQVQTRSVLAQLKPQDGRTIVLIDWDRLKNLWPNLRDESLCESSPGVLMLASTDLSIACPDMTFVRLRNSRETSMTMRLLVTKLYSGWAANGQAYEPTGDTYTERYLGPAHEIVEVTSPDTRQRTRPGRIGNRHYLQVMRYRRTVQLQRGYSCYRSSERMKKIDGSDKAADATSSKRFRLVTFPPAHEDAALPATTEITLIAAPETVDADQVVRMVMGLRLRYAHYPDWTSLPAPLFFIAKVDDYVIPYADVWRDAGEIGETDSADALGDVIEPDEVPIIDPLANIATESLDAEAPAPLNRDIYFDDVTHAIGEQLPQLQLFTTADEKGEQEEAKPMESIALDLQHYNVSRPIDNDSLSPEKAASGIIPAAQAMNGAGSATATAASTNGAAGTLAQRNPGENRNREPVTADAAAGEPVHEAEGEEQEDEEDAQSRLARRPKDALLAKAWTLINEVPRLYRGKEPGLKKLYEDMMREQVRVHVELPWFINVVTVVPADAWPDHKAINKYWRHQGDMGFRLPNKAAPSTGDFKSWLMRRLRIPQSAWTISPLTFKNGARLFDIVFDRYDKMVEARAAEGLDPPSVQKGNAFNPRALVEWLRTQEDDEGLAWLIAMAAHWPDARDVECIFEGLDGMELGLMSVCALEYLIDCCEAAKDVVGKAAAERRTSGILRKRDPQWEQRFKEYQQARMPAPEAPWAGTSEVGETTEVSNVPPATAGQAGQTSHAAQITSHEQGQGESMKGKDKNKTASDASAPAPAASQTEPVDASAFLEFPSSPTPAPFPEDQQFQALVASMTQILGVLVPGGDGFLELTRTMRQGLDRLDALHGEVLQARERLERERLAQRERQEALRADRLAREQMLLGFFEDLQRLCASIPEDLVHEPHNAPGSAEAWMPHALAIASVDFDSWMHAMRLQLGLAKNAAAQILSTHAAFEALDNGTNDRLSKLSGLARRQMQHKLQDELIAAADEANRSLAGALSSIAQLGPQDGSCGSGGPGHPANPSGGFEPGTKSESAQVNDGAAHAICAAASADEAGVAQTEASAAPEAPEASKALEAATVPGALQPVQRTGAEVVAIVDDLLPRLDGMGSLGEQGKESPPSVGAAAPESVSIPGATSQPAPEYIPDTVQESAPETAPAAIAVVVDPPFEDSDLEAEAQEEERDARVMTIDVDAELDVRKVKPLLEPLQRSADERLWKLTRVGVAALCAVHSHPTIEMHGLAWISMLDSLSALNSVNAEQRMNDRLFKWLEGGQQSVAGEGNLAFAMDVAVLGAGLLPILFEGHGAKVRWAVLSRIAARMQEDHKPLHELCEHLQSLDSSSFNITRENLSASRVGPRKAMEAEVLRQRDRAERWPSDQALFSNWPIPEYWDMHNAMFDDRHGMHFQKALQHVVRGSDEALRKMLPDLRKYGEKISGTMADLRKHIGRKRPLEGPHADKLAHNVVTTIKFLENYLELSNRLNSETTGDTPKPLRDFLDQLHVRTQAAQSYLSGIAESLAVRHGESPENALLRLSATLSQQVMQSTLALMNEQAPQTPVADNYQVLLMDVPLTSALQPVWSVQLEPEDDAAQLLDPLVVIAEVGSVQEQLASARGARPQQTIEDLLAGAADMHRRNGEVLAARAIEQRMRGASPQLLSQMQSANDAAHRKQKNLLSEDLSDARQRVTNALAVGPMTQAEASRMLKVIEVLDRANRANQIGAIAPTPTPYEDYPQARAILRHHILEPLEQRIQESLRALKHDIEVYREKLEKLDESERSRKNEQIERILVGLKEVTPTNIRVARYSFSLLEQDQLPFIKLGASNASQQFEAFLKDLRNFSSSHSPLESLRDALRGGDGDKHWPRGQKPAWVEALTSEKQANAADFIDAWITLTEARSFNDFHDPLAAFFKSAGTVEAPTALNEPGNTGRTAFHLSPKTFVGSARLQNFWVPPTLGSAARDLRGVVLRHRPAPELMAQVIGELPMNTPTFVLGRTYLSLARRSAITRDHPVIIVDDNLVAYMAVHPEQRLAKMMEVGLLTFHDNPYDDYGGPVPSEMFFGRRSELVRLNANKSAMVLYGGRRLGKSSLLDRIQVESRQNLVRAGGVTRGEVAIYIPLESRIDSAVFGDDHKLFAWMGIYRGMVSNNFIQPAKVEPKTAEGLRDHIRNEIMAKRALTTACYLLIDEADEVMARDLDSAGAFATSLRALTDEVRDICRIRYVIAGLHNLTRMHTEGNTALAKADVIALQPFSSGEDILMGVDLITRPLGALGFVFAKGSEDLPMRILAMCNFYPAFVQLYCKNLIQDLYNKRGNNAPVTYIEAADLDKVERNKDFIGVMQEKFRYNLDLDKRYKAIALVLADTYYSGSGLGVEHGLAGTEIRDLCQLMFPNHFSKTGEGAFPALLDEMEKLTVIDRKGARFQLRTPHIATMMGSRDDVDQKIDELARETALSNRIPGETRPFLIRGNGNERTPFPMPSGWVRQLLHEEERSLTVLVGNHLSGLSEIENLKQAWTIGHDAQYEVKYFTSADNARPFLNTMRRVSSNEASNRIVAVPSRSWKIGHLGDYTALANSLSRPLITVDARQRATNVRLLLVANPQQAWELAQMVHAMGVAGAAGLDLSGSTGSNGSIKPVRPGWRVHPVAPWNEDAVYYRLKQLENQTLPDHPDACASILQATMGFGGELSRLLRGSLTFDGIAQAREEVMRRVASSRRVFYDAIGWPVSIGGGDIAHAEELLALLDGESRLKTAVSALAEGCGVSPALLTFLRWMGLLQEGGDGTWRVPQAYKALITVEGAINATKAAS